MTIGNTISKFGGEGSTNLDGCKSNEEVPKTSFTCRT